MSVEEYVNNVSRPVLERLVVHFVQEGHLRTAICQELLLRLNEGEALPDTVVEKVLKWSEACNELTKVSAAEIERIVNGPDEDPFATTLKN